MKRYFLRLLRLKTLASITLIVAIVYIFRYLGDNNIKSASIQRELKESLTADEKDYFVPKSLKKIDWHNHEKINDESRRKGTGEQGLPAYLSKNEKHLEDELYSVNGFNGALSDKIPLNRSLPDIRHIGCKKRLYIESLPTVSVVVPFHNEHWSTLLRTAYSVLNRSPEFLIKEIFLVDDASTKAFLKQKLEDYISENVPKVKVIRLAQRSGLIAARLAGAARATADVLLFLDSHTEASVNWLPPLLEPIALDYRTVVCPFIDVIAFDTFEYRAQDEGARGAFDWELYYKRLPLLPADLARMPDPFPSPVMAGGLFAIARKFFWELGGYDPGLDIWGGEQYELSFKIWQCGGRLVDAPCSRVGHVYRKFAPFPNPGHGDFVGKNYRRVADVWMDEFAEHLYRRRPHYRNLDPGDLSEQRALRTRLRCKPFRWFMTQVAFDLTAKYPPVEPAPFAQGRVRPLAEPALCVDARHAQQMQRLQLRPCGDTPAAEQHFLLTWHKDIRCKDRNMCWDLPDASPKSPILLYGCHLGGGNQLWRYHPSTKQLKHGDNDKCLDFERSSRELFVRPCDQRATQFWLLDHVEPELMAAWETVGLRPTGPPPDLAS
ncbi:N-acetylgalactosaminyltransferase 6-like [Leptidea sinapis]|uniref:N-acetylgalactosaminyltransferase 6-like n=1 Tax=Leptidea sinapis TaxID=189913 RepID=UPI0021415C08|nr:N-acetylgalactosaminyltransferase 6-like [Leptidea sinapis]